MVTMLDADASPEDVLSFWFGPADDKNTVSYLQDGWRRWFFGKDALFDIVQRNSTALIARVAHESLSSTSWQTPRGLLARVLLLDQFTRCAFRGTANALAHDGLACQLARQLATSDGYKGLLPVERFFVCVALSHAEDLADNKLHVELASALVDGLPAGSPERLAVGDYFAGLHGFPHEHYETILKFGRFPHRNEMLGRPSTEAEEAWLASPPGWARSQRRAVLTYWDGRGLGDPVRFLLEFCLVPYDEQAVTDNDGFEELKASNKLAFGQVPLLEIDGLQLVQTQAILRYVAAKKGLRGATPTDEAQADMAVNGIFDARMGLITARFSNEPAAALSKFATATLPRLAAHLERLLGTHGGEYICMGGLTYADVALLECLCYAEDECEESLESLLRGCPRVLAHYRRMRAFPHVGEYLCSARRKPPPDAAFVRTTCGILGLPCPAYAQIAHGGAVSSSAGARRMAPHGRALVSALVGAAALAALALRLRRPA